MTTYTATAPNGKVITRNSKRVYTHAAALHNTATGNYFFVGFSGSAEGAIKSAKSEIPWCKLESQPYLVAMAIEVVAA